MNRTLPWGVLLAWAGLTLTSPVGWSAPPPGLSSPIRGWPAGAPWGEKVAASFSPDLGNPGESGKPPPLGLLAKAVPAKKRKG